MADGEITRAQYEELRQRIVSCAKDQGVILILEKPGDRYGYSVAPHPDVDAPGFL